MTAYISAKEFRRLQMNGVPKPTPRARVPRIVALVGSPVREGVLGFSVLPPSLNNAFVNTSGGRTKSKPYRKWLNAVQRDLKLYPHWHVEGRIGVRLFFGRTGSGADLDNLIKPVLDLLVSAGRISDDRNVVKIEAQFTDSFSGVRVEVQAQ